MYDKGCTYNIAEEVLFVQYVKACVQCNVPCYAMLCYVTMCYVLKDTASS